MRFVNAKEVGGRLCDIVLLAYGEPVAPRVDIRRDEADPRRETAAKCYAGTLEGRGEAAQSSRRAAWVGNHVAI